MDSKLRRDLYENAYWRNIWEKHFTLCAELVRGDPQASGIDTPMHTLVSELRVSRGRKTENMTVSERRAEITSILACAMRRSIRDGRRGMRRTTSTAHYR